MPSEMIQAGGNTLRSESRVQGNESYSSIEGLEFLY
jgi:hypothetical protein